MTSERAHCTTDIFLEGNKKSNDYTAVMDSVTLAAKIKLKVTRKGSSIFSALFCATTVKLHTMCL